MADDPSQNVHQDLLPHVHLLSTYRYALMSRVDIPEVTKWLTAAHKIARDTAPFYWTYLDAPQDGTIYLTWQPTAKRGLEFASDGYIWSGPEMFYRSEAGNGLVLEIYFQKAGFRMGEQIAAHSRRRFRLAPPQGPIPNMPQVDPNLWIVHYGPSEKQDRIPVNQIQIPPPMSQILNFRQYLSQMGQIVRKEFMLSDRVNWPKIPLPGRGQSLYAAPMPPRNVPQNMAYPPHPGPPGGPGAKRQRGHAQAAAHQPQMMAAPAQALDPTAFDDEEDISRGDLFDHLSPREVSMARYQQNHEWMEEILSSPYRIGQIEVADLGLGRRGELAPLTEGIFDAQGGDAVVDGPKNPYTGHLDPALAEEFRKRVHEKTESVRSEIEQMKIEHEKAMEKFRSGAAIKQAELDLRASTEGTGAEIWRLEGRVEESEEAPSPKATKKVDDILAEVEKIVGKKAAVVHDVHRIQDGGYIEPVPEPEPVAEPPQAQGLTGNMLANMSRQPSQAGSQASGVMIGDSDIDMGGTAAGLLDLHGGFSSTSTPINNFPTPQPHLSAIPSSVATPANMNAPSPQPAQPPTSQPQQSSGEDVRMEDADAPKPAEQGGGAEDWVVVPKGGVSPGSSSGPGVTASSDKQQQAQQQPPQTTAASAAAGNTPAAASALQAASSKPASAAPTPGSGLASFEGDANDFSSLGDLDTAGDALASYEHPETDLGMDMEDSAFGDAFHGVEGGSSVGGGGGLGGEEAEATPGGEIL